MDPECFEWLQTEEAPYCYVVYTNFYSGKKITASPKHEGMNHERFMKAMLASTSVPVLMEGVIIDGQVCYDECAHDIIPFGKAVGLGAETIVPIFIDPEHLSCSTSLFRRMDKVLYRTLAILLNETVRNDYEIANFINMGIRAKHAILQAFTRDEESLQKLRKILGKEEFHGLFCDDKRLLRIIDGLRPDEALTEDALSFNPKKMRKWMEMGERKSAEVVRESPFG